MTYPLTPSAPPLPLIASTVRVLLWVQFALSLPYCGLAFTLGFFADSYYVEPAAPRGADGDLPTGMLLLFPLVLLAAAPQLAVLAANLAPARTAWRRWAYGTLAAPLPILAALVSPLVRDGRVHEGTLMFTVCAAVCYALLPIATITCLSIAARHGRTSAA
ncbi:hypothetical protein GCM10009830_49010 [Glycomyces endophyticus]|uniref:Uncharacterized protein n=1 Tax=Glycomyces endophyticus TaxID=480996 RepID=A0ABP4TX04_9ACTN